uniref:Uncharacterized protein n=1 Tax=Callorhinchus milii TaxID=7868 RepID=A0A4W3H7M8_CALMI
MMICLFLGLTNEDIEQTKAIGWVTNIIQEGDHFKMITSLSNTQHVNEFTLGKEAMIHTFTGKKFKVTYLNHVTPNIHLRLDARARHASYSHRYSQHRR